jgi:NAD(P)-dependent dehydrogenase (short-subunit alcohol dehydrogenase family)
MALNYSVVRLMLGLLPKNADARTSHVVNVSSAGVQMGTPLFSAYIASKTALDAFTQVAAVKRRRRSAFHDGAHAARAHADDRADEGVSQYFGA